MAMHKALKEEIAQLKEEIRHLRAILSSLPCIVFAVDKSGIITLSTGKGLTQAGYGEGEVVGRNLLTFSGKYDFGRALSGELTHWVNDRNGRYFETILEPVRSPDDKEVASAFCGLTIDVTPQKLAENKGIDHELKTFWISRTTIDGRRLYISPNVEKYTGYDPGELIGGNTADPIHPDDLPVLKAFFARILSGSNEKDFEARVRMLHKDGHYIWVQSISNIVLNADGKPSEVVHLLRDITEEVERERLLQETLEKANSANRIKGEFLAMVSHELRTPLNSILGFTTVLSDTSLDSTQREFVDNIQSSAQALMCLLSDVLDFSRLEAGRIEVHNEVFDIRLCVEEALSIIAPAAAEKRLTLASIIDPRLPPMVCGDQNRIRQIVLNLFSNGVKFTPSGHVYISMSGQPCVPLPTPDGSVAEKEGEEWELKATVIDSGIGIPNDRLSLLFQPFSQVDGSITRKYGGTGLGLVICRRLANLMSGDVMVDSTSGSGTTFRFHLRVTVPTSGPIPTPPASAQPHLTCKKMGLVLESEVMARMVSSIVSVWGMEPISFLPQKDQTSPADLDLLIVDGTLLLNTADTKLTGCALDALHSLLPRVILLPFGGRPPDKPGSSYGSHKGDQPVTSEPMADVLGNNNQKHSRTLTSPPKIASLFAVLHDFFPPSGASLTTIDTSVAEAAAPLAPRPPFEQNPLRILLVDDVVLNQKVGFRLLQRLGYNPDMAGDGEEAVNMVELAVKNGGKPYDVILMDVHMPKMDGITATHRIRELIPPALHPQIIAVTADALYGHREHYLKNAFSDYLPKPIRLGDLEKVLARCTQVDGARLV